MAAVLTFSVSSYSADDGGNRFVPVAHNDVNGLFFSQVIYAPSVDSLVSWGTRTHAHKIRAHETQHFLVGENRWIDAFPLEKATAWAGHFKPWADWDICETGGIYLKGRTFADKRFFIRQLKSGTLLMIRNNSPDGKRSHLTAYISDDDSQTWKGGFVLDERESSYPDGIQAENGTIYIIYDHQRYTRNRKDKPGVGSVLMATIHEGDVRAGRAVTDKVRLRVVITQLRDTNKITQEPQP